ncbi:hypothetical protein ACOMHN_031575 [Nucella lapillus]
MTKLPLGRLRGCNITVSSQSADASRADGWRAFSSSLWRAQGVKTPHGERTDHGAGVRTGLRGEAGGGSQKGVTLMNPLSKPHKPMAPSQAWVENGESENPHSPSLLFKGGSLLPPSPWTEALVAREGEEPFKRAAHAFICHWTGGVLTPALAFGREVLFESSPRQTGDLRPPKWRKQSAATGSLCRQGLPRFVVYEP